ncbi:NAD(P)-dependent oxidoreductase [Atopobiaceae bacterium 24-176]
MRKIERIGFVGCGIMGAPIARHLLDAGFSVAVYTRTPEKAQGLLDAGAVWADTPAKACEGAQAVFTMVGMPEDVEEVYLSADGLLAAADPGTFLVDLTTSRPELAREISEAAAAMDVCAFDCPVTGGQDGAEAGTLTLIAGATEQQAAPLLGALEAFSSRIFWFGRAGAGQAAKLCNQISLAGAMVGACEAVAFARAQGLPVDEVCEMVGTGMGATKALEAFAGKIEEGDWRPGFKVRHMAKDLGLAVEAADDEELALPGTDTVRALCRALAEMGGADLGTQALEVLYEEEADAAAAGLDWSQAALADEDDDGCGDECCGHHHHGHDGCCGHHDHDGACGCSEESHGH